MLNLDDERWTQLEGGYRTHYDPRLAIAKLTTDRKVEAWDELWSNLYHQTDVGPASYAAVPLLVGHHLKIRDGEWQTFGLVGSIELARTLPQNPPVPEWIEQSYYDALSELGRLALVELNQANTDEQVGSMLGVVALCKGDRARATLLLEFTNDEVAELLEQYRKS